LPKGIRRGTVISVPGSVISSLVSSLANPAAAQVNPLIHQPVDFRKKRPLPADNGADARRWGEEEFRLLYLRAIPIWLRLCRAGFIRGETCVLSAFSISSAPSVPSAPSCSKPFLHLAFSLSPGPSSFPSRPPVKIGFGAKKHKLWGRRLSEGTRGFSSLVENEVHENFC
jgi:hypothetical protein